jgi:hypothetical protein
MEWLPWFVPKEVGAAAEDRTGLAAVADESAQVIICRR